MKRVLTGAAGSALLASAFLLPGVAAQSPGASPAASPAASVGVTPTGDGPHPAHIHSGTCAELGDVVEPLRDITDNEGGTGDIEVSITRVDMTIAQMVRNPHAINAHESAEAIQNYIACGEITGRRNDNNLVVELQEQNNSGAHGVSFLHEDGNRTVVFTVLFDRETDGEGLPLASPGIDIASPSPATIASPAPVLTPAASASPAS